VEIAGFKVSPDTIKDTDMILLDNYYKHFVKRVEFYRDKDSKFFLEYSNYIKVIQELYMSLKHDEDFTILLDKTRLEYLKIMELSFGVNEGLYQESYGNLRVVDDLIAHIKTGILTR